MGRRNGVRAAGTVCSGTRAALGAEPPGRDVPEGVLRGQGAILGCSRPGVSDRKRSKRPGRGGHRPLHLHPCQGISALPKGPCHLARCCPPLSEGGCFGGARSPPPQFCSTAQAVAPLDSEGRLEPPHVSTASPVLFVLPAPASPQPRAEPLFVLLYRSIPHGPVPKPARPGGPAATASPALLPTGSKNQAWL